jgi:hypothetical protein
MLLGNKTDPSCQASPGRKHFADIAHAPSRSLVVAESAACSLSDISGWRDGVLYPLAGGGRGIRRGAFWLRLLDLPGPALRLLTDVADFHFSDIAVH